MLHKYLAESFSVAWKIRQPLINTEHQIAIWSLERSSIGETKPSTPEARRTMVPKPGVAS